MRPNNKQEATQLAYENGWRIPKDRFDLRWAEIAADDNFWKCLVQGIKNEALNNNGTTKEE